jgi:hypothetical protein
VQGRLAVVQCQKIFSKDQICFLHMFISNLIAGPVLGSKKQELNSTVPMKLSAEDARIAFKPLTVFTRGARSG